MNEVFSAIFCCVRIDVHHSFQFRPAQFSLRIITATFSDLKLTIKNAAIFETFVALTAALKNTKTLAS
jgi:hypothetical protein